MSEPLAKVERIRRMLPYATSERDEPLSIIPWTTYALIAANVLVFFYEFALTHQGAAQLNSFIADYALVPCEYTAHCALSPGTPTPFWLTLLTAMFLHGGWAHILGNMLFLWVFGSQIERSMGHLRYLAFYLVCGLGASAMEVAMAPTSTAPGLGASGAISGVLAAYLLLYPTSSVSTLLPISHFVIPIRLPAWLMIACWFLLQLGYGIASLDPSAAADVGGVAYWAHVGGFFTGAGFIWLFQRPDYVSQLRAYQHQVA
jgi:membrane associated rhomboid family serine protease